MTQSSIDFIWPTSSRLIKSPYGWRIHPIEGIPKFHEGVDIERITNSDPVWAASDGIVVYSGFHTNSNGNPGYGNLVIINYNWQGKIMQTRYAHLASISVSKNQRISQGTRIGIMGTTGNSTGIHLHYEVREADSMSDTISGPRSINPETFHQFIDDGGGIQSIKDFMTIKNRRDVKVGFSDDGFGLSLGDRFLSLDYILNTSVDKLKDLGLTERELSLLIQNDVMDLNSNQIQELLRLQKLIGQ